LILPELKSPPPLQEGMKRHYIQTLNIIMNLEK
jgi:hypothetical protein